MVQHIVTALRDQDTGDWLLVTTQEWPVPDERHQLSFTLPYAFRGTAGEPSGPGDVFLNYRYGALMEGARLPAFTPRLSLLLPTGSQRDRLGNGSVGVQVGLPVSKRLGPVTTHANLGASFIPHALAPHGRSEFLASWFGGASVVWALADAINPLVELVMLREQDIGPRSVVTETHAFLSPGVRVGYDAPWSLQLVWGIAAPIGLTRDSADLGVLLYLSAEHAFTSAAFAARRW